MAISRFDASACVRLSVYGFADLIIIMIATMVAAHDIVAKYVQTHELAPASRASSPPNQSHVSIFVLENTNAIARHQISHTSAHAAHINFHFILESALFTRCRQAPSIAHWCICIDSAFNIEVEMCTLRPLSRTLWPRKSAAAPRVAEAVESTDEFIGEQLDAISSVEADGTAVRSAFTIYELVRTALSINSIAANAKKN